MLKKIVVVLVFLVAVSGTYAYLNGVRNEGIGYETKLNAQYPDNQNELSNYASSYTEQIGVANLKSEKMDQIILDAVKGRYENKDGNAVFGKGSPFFSAIVEAYPNLDLNVYDKSVSFVAAGREAYKAKQTKLLDEIRVYDKWRTSGYVQHYVISWMGFPGVILEARIGKKVLRGQEALDQMKLIVTTSGTREAYETGTMEPLKPPKD